MKATRISAVRHVRITFTGLDRDFPLTSQSPVCIFWRLPSYNILSAFIDIATCSSITPSSANLAKFQKTTSTSRKVYGKAIFLMFLTTLHAIFEEVYIIVMALVPKGNSNCSCSHHHHQLSQPCKNKGKEEDCVVAILSRQFLIRGQYPQGY